MVTMATCLLIYNCYVVMVTVTMAMLLGNIHTVVYDDGVMVLLLWQCCYGNGYHGNIVWFYTCCCYGNLAMTAITMIM